MGQGLGVDPQVGGGEDQGEGGEVGLLGVLGVAEGGQKVDSAVPGAPAEGPGGQLLDGVHGLEPLDHLDDEGPAGHGAARGLVERVGL